EGRGPEKRRGARLSLTGTGGGGVMAGGRKGAQGRGGGGGGGRPPPGGLSLFGAGPYTRGGVARGAGGPAAGGGGAGGGRARAPDWGRPARTTRALRGAPRPSSPARGGTCHTARNRAGEPPATRSPLPIRRRQAMIRTLLTLAAGIGVGVAGMTAAQHDEKDP